MSRWTAKRWLQSFRETGGMAWLHPRGLGVGWHVKGWSLDQQDEARRLSCQIETVPLRYEAAALQVAWGG